MKVVTNYKQHLEESQGRKLVTLTDRLKEIID